jgi:pyrroline-5-carboxylate reductase
MKLAVLGVGNMGGAIVDAVLRAQLLSSDDLLLIEAHPEQRASLRARFQCLITEQVSALRPEYNFVLLAIKPQQAPSVLPELTSVLDASQTLLSVLAGTAIPTIQDWTQHQRVARVMPNTPAQIAAGMSVYYADASVPREARLGIRQIFEACGSCLEVHAEEQIDAATAISGSGPAYVFYLAEQMVAQAQELGFSPEEATQLTQQTLLGATQLWQSGSWTPTELRQRVTSPGGTTAAALDTFDQKHVGHSIQAGLQQAFLRARELSRA